MIPLLFYFLFVIALCWAVRHFFIEPEVKEDRTIKEFRVWLETIEPADFYPARG
jgi:hypothetical protein